MFSYWAPPASRPAPRRRARSMLSFGTELFLAFWIAWNSVGLPAGSPPPVRAATSTFLISLANSFPRLASTTAFLCLVVAHLEWPLILVPSQCLIQGSRCSKLPAEGDGRPLGPITRADPAGPHSRCGFEHRSRCLPLGSRCSNYLPRVTAVPLARSLAQTLRARTRDAVLNIAHGVGEELVQPQVRRQLRMERRGQRCPLADRDDPARARVGTEYLDVRAGLLYPRRPDEYSAQRGPGHSPQLDVAFERVHLTAERVPPHRHIDSAERLLPVDPVDQPVRQHDHPGAAAERGQAGLYSLAHRLHQVERDGQLPHRGGLAARDDQAADLVELLWPADRHRRRAHGGQRSQMLGDVTLQGEHADERPSASARRGRIAVPRHQPRPA